MTTKTQSTYAWIDSCWLMSNGKPTVVLFGRDIETKKVKKIGIQDFVPYFWAPLDEITLPDEVEEGVSCFGDAIGKVVVNTPDQVPVIRNKFTHHFEADVPFDIRYTVDKKIFYAYNDEAEPVEYEGGFLPRIGYYDIEVEAPPEIMPDPENPIYPIKLISILDSYTNKVRVFTVGGRQVDDDQVICATEDDLFRVFSKYVASMDFDVVTAWNGKKFDDPYFVRRARLINCYKYIQPLSRISGKWVTENRFTGRILIDMMVVFRDWSKPMGKMPTGLKYIAKKFANFEYDDEGNRIKELIANDEWEKLVKYSKNDVIAMQKIDEAIGLFQFYENIRRKMGVKLNDIFGRAVMIETLLMKRGIKPMPTRTLHETDEDLIGALVLKPPIGIHSNVGGFDLKALYPTIIIAKDISPDIDHMIPKTITEMMEEREKYRVIRMAGNADENMKNSETAIKYIVNAFYGYMAYKRARLFKIECAQEVTGTGREIARSIHKELKVWGYDTVYGDTDSSFVKGILTPETGIELQGDINKFLLKWSREQGIKDEFAPIIKFEKLYKRIMFKRKTTSKDAAKKRYAGWLVWKDGYEIDKIDFVGLETNRSDSAEVTKDAMRKFFTSVLKDNDTDSAIKMVRNIYRDVVDGNIDLQTVSVPKGIHKKGQNNPHTRGMKTGTKVYKIQWYGMEKPKLLYCKRPFKEVCIDSGVTTIPPAIDEDGNVLDIPAFEIDWNKQAEKTIKQKMKPLLDSIGVDWEQSIAGQTSLFDF
jgi:DNA polymerase I